VQALVNGLSINEATPNSIASDDNILNITIKQKGVDITEGPGGTVSVLLSDDPKKRVTFFSKAVQMENGSVKSYSASQYSTAGDDSRGKLTNSITREYNKLGELITDKTIVNTYAIGAHTKKAYISHSVTSTKSYDILRSDLVIKETKDLTSTVMLHIQ